MGWYYWFNCLSLGAFNAVHADNLVIQQGAVGSNPLNIIVSVIPNNLINAFTIMVMF